MLDRLTTIPAAFIAPDGKRLSRSAYVFLVLLCLAFFVIAISFVLLRYAVLPNVNNYRPTIETASRPGGGPMKAAPARSPHR